MLVMQFIFIFIFAVFTSVVAASALPPHLNYLFARDCDPKLDHQVVQPLWDPQVRDFSLNCVSIIATDVQLEAAACINAGIKLGLDPGADISCIANIVDKMVANIPSPCQGCASKAKEKIKSGGRKVAAHASSAGSKAKAGVTGAGQSLASGASGAKKRAKTLGGRISRKLRPKPSAPEEEIELETLN
ncbi:hypothetical protein H0H93_007752 [Arthromyces matolae]|nr:hypothetical protein H0H93_007752 [Arthromyces matolae]